MKTLCKVPICRSCTIPGSSYCKTHLAEAMVRVEERNKERAKQYDKQRSIDHSYYHSKEWRSLRQLVLDDYPNCQARLDGCKGKAVIVHHKVKRIDGGSDCYTNLQAVCRQCHGTLHRGHRDKSNNRNNNSNPPRTDSDIKPAKSGSKPIDYKALFKNL